MRRNLNYLKDSSFLLQLDNEYNKTYQVKINVLDLEEAPVESIEGRVLPGSTITIDGTSSVRRTCSITFIADDIVNDLTDVDNLLSVNKKIEILVGLENNIDRKHYEDIIWFPQGIYVIVQPSITQNANGCTINLTCKDKMCLLNGERGGNLPTSVLFHAYKERVTSKKVKDEDEIYSLIDNGEINEFTVYQYEYEEEQMGGEPVIDQGDDPEFDANEDQDQEYVSEQITVTKYAMQNHELGIYEVQSDIIGTDIEIPNRIYDIIKTLVCNYGQEDEERVYINDVPLEIKQLVRQENENSLYCKKEGDNYIYSMEKPNAEDGQREFITGDDVGYTQTDYTYPDKLISNIGDNVCTILDKIKNLLGNYEYYYDIDGNFIFQEIKNYLNKAYDPTVVVRLDGEDRAVQVKDEEILPYNNLCIVDNTNYLVEYNSNAKIAYAFNEGTGLINSYANTLSYSNLKNDFHIQGKKDDKNAIHYHLVIKRKPAELTTGSGIYGEWKVVYLEDGRIRLKTDKDEEYVDYLTTDQRAELYLQGLEAKSKGLRPDIYQQELLDLFDGIYNFQEKKFKADLVNHPNNLDYFFDYLEPYSGLGESSVDVIKTKVHSYQSDSVKTLCRNNVPNCILINNNLDETTKQKLIQKCVAQGQLYAVLIQDIYSKTKIGRKCYTAQEVAQELLYQYTNYNETIVLQSVPIYYLEPNTRISVYNQKAGMYGDYVIKNISLPIDAGGIMTINAIRALERV